MFAQALAANGARKVYIVGRRKEVLESAAKKISVNGNVIHLPCDITSKPALLSIAERVRQEVGYINLLIANAGILCKPTGLIPRPEGTTVAQVAQDLWEKTTWEDADSCLATNIAGSYFTFIAFLKLLGAGNEHP